MDYKEIKSSNKIIKKVTKSNDEKIAELVIYIKDGENKPLEGVTVGIDALSKKINKYYRLKAISVSKHYVYTIQVGKTKKKWYM